jgi:hypothetical protein
MSASEFEKPLQRNVHTLEQARRIADELLSRLDLRTESAEGRAKILLTICAGAASLLAAYGAGLASAGSLPTMTFQHFVMLALTVLLFKTAWYSLSTLRPAKGYEITADLIAAIEEADEVSALEKEVKWKTWVYKHNEQYAVRKFYAYDRAQRNFILFVFLLTVAVPYVVFRGMVSSLPAAWLFGLRYGIGCSLVLLALMADRLVEPFSIWQRRDDQRT